MVTIIIIIIIIIKIMIIIIIIIIQTLAKTIYLIHTYPNELNDQPLACHELLFSSNYSLSNPDQITNIVPRCPQR